MWHETGQGLLCQGFWPSPMEAGAQLRIVSLEGAGSPSCWEPGQCGPKTSLPSYQEPEPPHTVVSAGRERGQGHWNLGLQFLFPVWASTLDLPAPPLPQSLHLT